MASIRKRTWTSGGEIRSAWVCDYVDQKGKRRLKTFKAKKAADAWLVQARGEVARGVHTPDSTSVTVAAAAEMWLERCERDGLERATIRQYETHVRHHIEPLLGREKLSKLSTPLVEAFKDALLRTRSRPLARKVLGSLKTMLRHAQRRGLVAQNAAEPVRVEANGRHKRKIEVGVDVPTKGEVKALVDAAPPRWRPLIMTATFCGLRASELRGLAWEHVDFEAKVIRVRQRADRWNTIGSPKSASSARDVPMAPLVLNGLREWRLACPRGEAGLVFPTGRGNVENHGNILRRVLGPLQVRCGIVKADGKPKYALHAFRHFFASWLIDQGFGPKRVQALMGHASITMTFDVYGHLFPAEDDQAKFAAGELAIVG